MAQCADLLPHRRHVKKNLTRSGLEPPKLNQNKLVPLRKLIVVVTQS